MNPEIKIDTLFNQARSNALKNCDYIIESSGGHLIKTWPNETYEIISDIDKPHIVEKRKYIIT